LLDHLKQVVPKHLRRKLKSYLPQNVQELAVLRHINRHLTTSQLKLALYDPDTGTLRFPESMAEIADILRLGMIGDAVPWMLKIDPYVPERGMVFDVGGFRGITSQWFARRASQVHTFEPMPESVESIRMALRARGILNVEVHQLAVSDREGMSEFHIHEIKGHNSLGHVNTSRRLSSITVETTTLDSFAAKHRIETVDFLKIDVEGFEFEVLKGASQMLAAKQIRCLLFEANRPVLSSLGKTVSEIYDLLSANEYAVTNVDGHPMSRADLETCQFEDLLARPRP
jgi:FkbM family methyltransferase